jgi:hypothetical protein
LLNFTPELVDRAQKEAEYQNSSFDALIRAAVEKHLKDLGVAREQDKEYSALVLKLHFEEDRTEFLTEDNIHSWSQKKS